MALAAQFRSLLDGCQAMQLRHLRPLVERMFEDADVALLDFANKAENNMAQSLFFDAMSEVRKQRNDIEKSFYTELDRGFREFPARPDAEPADHNVSADELTLVDPHALELSVAAENTAGKLISRIMNRIFALRQRLAVINGGAAIEETQIPGGPAWLASAYRRAVEQADLDHKVRMVFIALFDKYVLGRADALFDEYNKRLIEADILPNLRYEVHKHAGSVEIIEKEIHPGEPDTDDAQPRAHAAAPEAQTPSELGDEVFARICELMAGRGRGNRAGGGQPARDPRNGAAPLLGQISKVQAGRQRACADMSNVELIENIEIDQLLIERLQDTLADERGKILNAVQPDNAHGVDSDLIELVGMMFEYMLMDESLPNLAKVLLSRLHTPLLKVAVLDRRFFSDQAHAARRLLNDMTAAGIRWLDEAHPERGIFPKMKQIVDRVLRDFHDDVALFDELLDEFTTAVEALKQRASRVEQRTNEAANGQEKLLAARTCVQEELRALMRDRAVAQVARDFLQRILADRLTFILLRSEAGQSSDDWQRSVTLATRVIESVAGPEDTGKNRLSIDEVSALQEDIRATTGSLQQAGKDKLLDALFALQNRVARGTATTQSAAPADMVLGEPAPVRISPAAEMSPEQQQVLEHLKTLPFGTWFEFQQHGEAKKRVKLSWRSNVTEKYMFVDQMGVKAAVIGMHDLANCMLEGTARIVTASDKKPFVDRALDAIQRMLDHAA